MAKQLISTQIAVMSEQINTIGITVHEIKEKLEKDYVTKAELAVEQLRLSNVEKIVYGMVAILLSGIIIAILKLVFIK